MSYPQAATERVGRYQILELIGAGPNGTVSRAKVFGVAGFERQFAIKRFAPELTVLTQHAQALSSAARAYGSLEHPRIARMSEFGVAGGVTFTAVEHVAGVDAWRLIAETKNAGIALPHGGVLAIVSQVARAVGYAHGRGICHLGLAPTNVLVTVEGDVKVTDFGLLAATWPPRPLEVARLGTRISYCAPEQLGNEATSAATDVFALGVLAYELVTGHRAFHGDTTHAVAQAILAGPPPEPMLPRPIVRVLQRCLARSPFERFPDARALADALDAALRVAPVPGTRKDVGTQVKAILDRLALLNEGQLSGMLAINLEGSGRTSSDSIENIPTRELARSDLVPPPGAGYLSAQLAASESPASTMPELQRPTTTVAGLAPPPIPVPPGIATAGGPPPTPTGTPTIMGITAGKRPPVAIPKIVPRRRADEPATLEPVAPARASTPAGAPGPEAGDKLAASLQELAMQELAREEVATQPIAPSRPEIDFVPYDDPAPEPPVELEFKDAAPTARIAPQHLEQLHQASGLPTNEVPPLIPPAPSAQVRTTPPAFPLPTPPLSYPVLEPPVHQVGGATFDDPTPLPPPSSAALSSAPRAGTWTSSPPPASRASHPDAIPRKARWPWIALSLVSLGAIAAAAWYVFVAMPQRTNAGKPPEVVAKGSGSSHIAMTPTAPTTPVPDATVAPVADASLATLPPTVAQTRDAGAPPITVSAVAPTAVDAGVAVAKAPGDAPATAPPVATVTPSDSLAITSTPPGARVFLDGADQGVTPVKLAGSGDRHTLALLLAGHELYTGQIDGHGKLAIELKPITPHGGPAGIKVIKCQKDRYYVFVDGAPTGMTCPTERIHTDLGAHTVEVYDMVSETRQKWDISITDTRLSYRVRVEN